MLSKADFETFVTQQQEPLRRFLLGICAGNRAMADDIAQEAFIKCYVHLSSFQGKSKLSTWLFKIAYNCFYDYLKREKRYSAEAIDKYDYLLQDTPTPDNEKEQLFYRILSKLKNIEREVLLLFYMEEKSLKEIAAITGLPVNTVKSHLRRAKQHLKTHLEKTGYEKR